MNIVVPPNLKIQCFVGGPASGKTDALIAHAQTLAAPHTQQKSASVAFICASQAAAEYVRPNMPDDVTVGTVQDFALKILQSEGMRCRLLSAYEEQFLFEDLRTCGLPQKALRRILDYLYASMENLHAWGEDWIEMREERLVYDTLMAILNFTGGISAPEISASAAAVLAHREQARQTYGFDHILIDDYHLHSRASQLLCLLLAQESMTVASGKETEGHIQKPYANDAGVQELCHHYKNASVVNLTKQPDPIAYEHVTAPKVTDEFKTIIERIHAHEKTEGAATSIAVVATQGVWLKNMRQALSEHNIAFMSAPKQMRIHDFTDEEACTRAAQDALAILANNAHDGVALRTLFGLGDHLARSAALKRIREQHPKTTLAKLHAENPLEIIEHNAKAYAARKNNIAQKAAGEEEGMTSYVFVGMPQDLLGKTFDLVIFGGCVEGWLPARAYFEAVGNTKERLLNQALGSLTHAQHAARKMLLFTSFEECSLEFAERLDLHYEHIRLKDGVRTCELRPSALLSRFS